MKKQFFLPVIAAALIFLGCDDKATSGSGSGSDTSNTQRMGIADTSGLNSADSMKMMQNSEALAMIERFRDSTTKIKKPHPNGKNDKSTLWVTINLNQLKQLLADESVTAFHVMTAAYTNKKPTMLIRIIRNNKMDQPFYYGVATEDLCPEPPDCGTTVPVPAE